MARGLELFNSDVAKLLSDHCLDCHGGEKGAKGDLDLATREGLLIGGLEGPAVVPGKAKESFLMKLIRHEEDPAMPKKADKLPDAAIAKIAEWIDLGAPYAKPLIEGKAVVRDKSKVSEADRQFWSFVPLANPEVPVVKDQAWCRTLIDRFIRAKQEEKGIMPNSLVDRRKLVRRAYLDLLGLPPTPEQVEGFVHDPAPDAYEKLLDELLASPHYGERWGRHWLDLARFAESHGYEQDYDRKFAYHYRDFVIRALNNDLPYDKFVQWQIAGDELEPGNAEAWFATGFLAAGTHATQITANQAEKERYDELDDKVATIGTAMLGLTIGCARCHDHKFDPLPDKDYYRLLSTFTTTVRSDYDVPVNPAAHSEKHAQWEREHAPLAEALAKWEREVLPARVDAWLKAQPTLPEPDWFTLDAGKLSVSGPYYSITQQKRQPDGSHLVTVTAGTPDTYTFTTKVTLPGAVTAIRLEAMADKSLPGYGPGWSGRGGFKMDSFSVRAKSAQVETPWKLADANTQWDQPEATGRDIAKIFRLAEPVRGEGEVELRVQMKFDSHFDRRNIGRFRLAISTSAEPSVHAETVSLGDFLAARRALEPTERSPEQVTKLSRLYRLTDPEWQKLSAAVHEHAAKEPRPELVKALVCSEGLPAVRLHTQGPDFYDKTYFLRRGDLNQKQGEAQQGFLQVLTRAPEERWQLPAPEGARTLGKRAALARWITDVEAGAGHLLARVIVNRLWQHHLGRGIVGTPSDFGSQGERPTHPELLDWLAQELIRNEWRLKPLHKLIMLSAVYQQGSESNEQRRALDPDNTLWWHKPRQRLEAEIIRDSILAVSGALDRKMLGPGTLDPNMRRRSIYFTLKRSQLPPMLVTFDAPDTLQSMGQRATTTVAPQALLLMNNPAVRTAARKWAERIAPGAAQSGEDALRRVYLSVLGREPDEDELTASISFLRSQEVSYGEAGKSEPAELAWTDLLHAMLGLNEFVYVD